MTPPLSLDFGFERGGSLSIIFTLGLKIAYFGVKTSIFMIFMIFMKKYDKKIFMIYYFYEKICIFIDFEHIYPKIFRRPAAGQGYPP